MKKVLSVILVAVMLACCIPFTAFALPQETLAAGAFSETDPNSPDFKRLESGREYIINSGVTVTIPAERSLDIPTNSRLTVEHGGTLDVLGKIIVNGTGSIFCEGTINHSSNIKLEDANASAQVQIRFPDLADPAVMLSDKITVDIWYEGMNPGDARVPVGGGRYNVPLNTEIRIDAHILEDHDKDSSKPVRDKFDDSLLKVAFNNVGLSYVTGEKAGTGYFTTTATTGGDISFAKWTSDNDFLTTKRIVLPSGEGYEVLPRYPDKIQKTEDGVIVVKYGDPFSFYVDLDEAYDMSKYEVYIYNGYGWLNLGEVDEETGNLSLDKINAQPDDYGYYNIRGVTGDITVTVTGVMKNATINLIGNLLETFRSIFNMLKEFIEGIKELFTGAQG